MFYNPKKGLDIRIIIPIFSLFSFVFGYMKLTTNILPKPSYCRFKFKITVSVIHTVASVTEST